MPDVAGDADPNTGYRIRVDGQDVIIGGTSAVAPLWAALLALINQKLGTPSGFVNPLLYSQGVAGGGFNDIVNGNNGNGGYNAGPGWDTYLCGTRHAKWHNVIGAVGVVIGEVIVCRVSALCRVGKALTQGTEKTSFMTVSQNWIEAWKTKAENRRQMLTAGAIAKAQSILLWRRSGTGI